LFAQRRPTELLFAGEQDGKYYVVTESHPQCFDIRQWLAQVERSK
jgi:hypothetical protein